MFTVPLEAQMNQIKIFNKYLINLALQKDYTIKRIDVKKGRRLGEQQFKADEVHGIAPQNDNEQVIEGDSELVKGE